MRLERDLHPGTAAGRPLRLLPGGRSAAGDVPFLDLDALHGSMRDELIETFDRVLRDGAFVGGRFVESFERAWAEFCGVRHAVGVGNGTDALELVIRALDIGPGDEVVLPANTFVATAEAVVAAGARPVYCDVDPETLLMTAAQVADRITPATAAIIVVHLYGQTVAMDELAALARGAGLAVIEDAAQAHGATWNGRRAGSLADAGCFSFYPGKNLGALGDAGAVVTDDPALAERVRSLGNHGRVEDRHHVHGCSGRNSRLDGLQAAFLEAKIGRLPAWNAGRRRAASRYDELLGAAGIRTVVVDPRAASARHLYVARVDERDRVRAELARAGIATGVHYPTPVHRQPGFAADGTPPLPVVEAAAGEIVSLPLFPTMGDDQVEAVCDALVRAVTATAPRPVTASVGGP